MFEDIYHYEFSYIVHNLVIKCHTNYVFTNLLC